MNLLIEIVAAFIATAMGGLVVMICVYLIGIIAMQAYREFRRWRRR